MSKPKAFKDPRGHSLRVYSDVFDSAAFAALSPHDVLAYLALLRELKGYNNGDLSLPLTRAKKCGIGHHMTLARSLRALCAVGLIAVTRKGGCTKGGQRLPNLYRLTDRECYAIPAKHLEAMKETNEWKRVATAQQGKDLIAAAESSVKASPEKLKSLGHGVTHTTSPRDLVGAKIRTPRDTWIEGLGHGVTMAKKAANPATMRVPAEFSPSPKKASHRTPRVSPLYIATPTGQTDCIHGHGSYRRLTAKPVHLFTGLLGLDRADSAKTRGVTGHTVDAGRSAVAVEDAGDSRLKQARAAQQKAIARQAARSCPKPSTVAAVDADGLTRERDEHAHDTSAWAD